MSNVLDRTKSHTIRVVPFATGADGKHKLSVTAEDLQMLLHDLQVSPNLLYPLYQAENLGTKSQYNTDGKRKRAG